MYLKQKPQDYFPALTGIRAIAAYMVFFHHSDQQNELGLWYPFHRLLMEFHTGVSVFFVLSGFLITYRYYGKLEANKKNIRHYLVNRFARIYPMFALLSVATFVYKYYANVGRESVFVVTANLFLIKGYFNDIKLSGIAQAWSLSVEETFYLLAPLLFLFYRRIKRVWLLVFLLLACGALLVTLANALTNPYGFMQSLPFALSYTFFGRCFEFLAGMWLAIKIRDLKGGMKFQKSGIGHTFAGVAIIFGAILLMGWISYQAGVKYSIQTLTGIGINNFLLPMGVVLLFSGLLRERSLLRSCLQTRLFQELGKSSYVFYLIHMGILSSVIGSWSPSSNMKITMFWNFALLNIIALLLHRFLEEPVYRLIKKHSGEHRPPILVSPSSSILPEMYEAEGFNQT